MKDLDEAIRVDDEVIYVGVNYIDYDGQEPQLYDYKAVKKAPKHLKKLIVRRMIEWIEYLTRDENG